MIYHLIANSILLLSFASACSESRPIGNSSSPLSAPDTVIPTFRGGIPSEAAEAQFTDILQAIVGPDTALYVLDRNLPSIVVFDSNGHYLRSIGRKGSGPGEFEGIGRFGFLGDTIWIEDWSRRRTAWFDLQGTYLRASAEHASFDSSMFPKSSQPIAYLSGGASLYEAEDPSLLVPLEALAPIVIVHSNATRDTLASRTVWREVIPIAGAGTLRIPRIQNYALLSVDSHGHGVALVERAPDSLTGAATVRIKYWNESGRPGAERVFRDVATIKIPDTVRSDLHEKGLGILVRNMSRIRELQEHVQDPEQVIRTLVRIPKDYPPIEMLRLASGGEIWLQRTAPSDSVSNWLILDTEARTKFLVLLPKAARVEDAFSGLVWVTIRDSLDVPRLVKYSYE